MEPTDDMSQDDAPAISPPVCEDFQERGTPEQLAALYGALATARGQFGPIEKTRTVKIRTNKGGDYEFSYADMQALLSATTPALSANGLTFLSPFTRVQPHVMTQHAILAHKDGARLVFLYKFEPPTGNDLKTLGGEQTYLTRYAYRSVLTLPGGEDLDEMPQERVRGETGAESRPAGKPANGPNNTQRIEPSQRPTPNPTPPPEVDKAAANRLSEVKQALRNAGYTTVASANSRVAAAFHGEVLPWQTPGGLTLAQHDALMNGLLDERAAQMTAKEHGFSKEPA